MKAVRLLEYGGQLVFNDVPTPAIARDEILVKIKSTAVNHLDLVEASGTARQIFPIDLPWIPGHEFSGVVEQIGSEVAACAQGDAVFGTTSGMGAYAEYLAVKAAAIARKPSNLSFEEAASVTVASQTAWQGIFTHGHLEKGQTILIHGGAGAVGAYAVQLASHAGATVIATASGDDEAYLNSIGASQVIDYQEVQFEKVLREKIDVVFDLIGGDTQKRSFLVLKEGGHLVAATQPVSQEETARHRVSGAMMRLAPSADGLDRIARLLEEGTIRPDVATVYALQDAAQAWKDIAGICAVANWAASYVMNDLYRLTLRPKATAKEYVLMSRIVSALLLVLALAWGAAIDPRQLDKWVLFINSALMVFPLPLAWLKWFWWRTNVFGDLVGVLGAFPAGYIVWFGSDAILPQSVRVWFKHITNWNLDGLVPAFGNLNQYPFWAGFGILFVLGWICILPATLLTRPESDSVLASFYRSVRPIGRWKPVRLRLRESKQEAASVRAQTRRDLRACAWGVGLYFFMVVSFFALMGGHWREAGLAAGLAAVAGFFFKECLLRRGSKALTEVTYEP